MMSGEGLTADTKSVMWPKRLLQDLQLEAISKLLGLNKHRNAEQGKKKIRGPAMSQKTGRRCPDGPLYWVVGPLCDSA